MSKFSKIRYNGIDILFDRGLTAFSPIPRQEKNVIFGLSGVPETLNFYRYWNFSFARAHAHAGLKNQLMAFWDYVRTGASFSFWHDRDLTGYWNFEGKSLKSSDEIDGTFTRATAAFYLDPDTGLLTEVNSGIARFQAGKFGRGILIERAATNILIHSTEFNDAGWNATNIAVTTNTGVSKSPAASGWETTADLATLTLTSGSFQRDTTTNIGTNNAVFSVYLKTHEAGNKTGTLYIKRADTDATLASQAITITSSWQRFFVAYPTAGSITADWRVRIELNGASGEAFAIWGGMLEAGANILVPSTFVVTTTVSATRNAETLVYPAASFLDDEPIRGTIAFWFIPNFTTATNVIEHELIWLDDIAGTGRVMRLFWNSSDNLLFSFYFKNTSLAAQNSFSMSGYAFPVHIAVTWDLTISNGLKMYLNGVLVHTSANDAFAPLRIGTNLRIGNDDTTSNTADGVIDDLLIRKDVLDAGEIYDIARSQQPLGYDRNYWSALMIEERQYTQNRLSGVPLWDIEIPVREVLS